jgi:hypothetical protein
MKMKAVMLAAMLLTLFMFTTAPSYAQQGVINACYGKVTGVMRIVSDPSKCLRTENPLSWNATGSPGPAGPPGPEGEGGIKVYSANNVYLGILVDLGYFYIPSLGKLISLYGDDRATLHFKTEDCTGTPYGGELNHLRGEYLSIENLHDGKYKFYYSSEPAENATFLSRKRWDGTSFHCDAINITEPLATLIEVALPFAYPWAEPLKLQ